MTRSGAAAAVVNLAGSAQRLGRGDPFADLTDHQWYYHQARQTVFYAAFSTEVLDRARLVELAGDLIGHVPGFAALHARLSGRALDRDALAAVVAVSEVEALDAYPDAWDMSGGDLFVRHDLPMLRVRAVVRRGGPDAAGRRSALLVLATHALLEGADSALLSRSHPARHDRLAPPAVPQSAWVDFFNGAIAAVLGPAQLAAAHVLAPRRVEMIYRSLVLERAALRRVASRLALRQRSLLFALVLFALNRDGKGFSRRRIAAIYSEIDARNRAERAGAFFRHFISEAGFRVSGDFAVFARAVEAEIDRLEARRTRMTQGRLSALFGVHRTLRRLMPLLYSERIFRFAGFYHINLSITPPHRLSGSLTRGLCEPVYAGTFHPGLDMCIFVPGKHQVTVNFTVRSRHIDQIAAVAELLAALDEGGGRALEKAVPGVAPTRT